MKEFNLFDEMLKESISFDGGYYVLAAEGDDSKFHYEDRWWRGERILLTDLSSRKTESHRMTQYNILVYDKGSKSLDWKSTYRNTKGVYFKKGRDTVYLIRNK